jgi:hypothetical protein
VQIYSAGSGRGRRAPVSVRMIDGGQPQQRGDGIGMGPKALLPTRLARATPGSTGQEPRGASEVSFLVTRRGRGADAMTRWWSGVEWSGVWSAPAGGRAGRACRVHFEGKEGPKGDLAHTAFHAFSW